MVFAFFADAAKIPAPVVLEPVISAPTIARFFTVELSKL